MLNKLFSISLPLSVIMVLTAAARQKSDKNLGIIPAPVSIEVSGGTFNVRKITEIICSDADGRNEANLLHDFLLRNYQLDAPIVKKAKGSGRNSVMFSGEDYTGKNAEGYSLSISSDLIKISGKNAGLFYGLQSLFQVIQYSAYKDGSIPCALIADEPRYPYRGIMQDVGYHIFPVEFIKQEIDMLAKYKMNVYHWHLTEDHGWRIEIKKYPKLTEIGSLRAQSPVNNYNDEMGGLDNTPYGGFYTQAEIRDIVAYAAVRHVTIIPEIELPGHSLAALAAYPELACGDNPGPFKVAENWGIYDDVYCAGKDRTFEFLEDVLTEVISLFPGKYIHIGGDECPKDRWEQCKYCQKRMKDNKLQNEHELQNYFVSRIEKFVNSKGRSIIGWDEILEGGLAPNATVMSWRGIQAGIEAAKQGHDVVMASESHLYFDFIQGPRELEPLAIGVGYNPLERVYSFNPTPEVLDAKQQKFVIGVEAPLWTEHMETSRNVEYMLYPRMYALAEIGWTPLVRKDYGNFSEERLPKHLAALDRTGVVYRVPTPIGQKDTTLWGKEFDITLKNPVEGAAIYYNMEGQDVRESDFVYQSPLHISVPEGEMRQLKTIVVAPSGKRSIVTTTTFANKAPLKSLKLDTSLLKPGLKYFLVLHKPASADLIDISKVMKQGVAAVVNPQKINEDDDYSLVYNGYVSVNDEQVYTFALPHKGAELRIDDDPGVRSGNIYNPFDLQTYHYQEKVISYRLKPGIHKIEIRYVPSEAGNRFKMPPSVRLLN